MRKLEDRWQTKYETESKEYRITNPENGNKIYGVLYFPKGNVPLAKRSFPAIILSHGFNGSHLDFQRECRYYAQNGFVAYAFDFCGGSVHAKSDGSTTDMTIFSEKSDLRAVFEAIRSLEQTDSDRMYLFGGSQGGLVTTLVAEELGSQVRGMALYYPAFNIPEDWRKNFPDERDIPTEWELWGMTLGKNFFTSIRNFDTFKEIGRYRGRVRIIYGSEDPIVPSGAMEKAENIYDCAELFVLPGEGHGFSPAGAKTAMELVLEFLLEEE